MSPTKARYEVGYQPKYQAMYQPIVGNRPSISGEVGLIFIIFWPSE